MRTKTLEHGVNFKASPIQVYEMLMDSEKHAALTGLEANISNNTGGEFTAGAGHIRGFNLALEPGKKIVQAWRASGWWPGYYSIAIYDLDDVKGGTRLSFTQIGIPPNRYSGHQRGWIETYWTPMKEIFASGEISKKTREPIKADIERIKEGSFRRRTSNKA